MRVVQTIIILVLTFSACKTKTVRIVSNSEIKEGPVFKDSLFHGKVSVYNKDGTLSGITNYKYGILDGPSSWYFPNGILSDSFNYENGLKHGYAFNYHISGQANSWVYFFHNKIMGPSYSHDERTSEAKFDFITFEGKVIYQSKIQNNDTLHRGSLINLRVRNVREADVEKNSIFLYLIYPPEITNRYALGVLDSINNIISTKNIIGKVFHDEVLEPLPQGQTYAVILYTYNDYKRREDLQIAKLEPEIVYGFEEF